MFDAKPIPGTNKVVMSASPGHGRPEHVGPIDVVDPSKGPDVAEASHKISKEPVWQGVWRDPYAISEDCFLVARGKGLFLMDGQGNTEPIYELPGDQGALECHEPRPMVARPRERVIPPRVDLSKTTGRLVLSDIYAGRNMEGVKRGEIKKLLVLKQLPKPVNFSGGMEPLTIGGTFTLAEIVGDGAGRTGRLGQHGIAGLAVVVLRRPGRKRHLGQADAQLRHRPARRDDRLRRLPREASPGAALEAGTGRDAAAEPRRRPSRTCPACLTSHATSSRSWTNTASSVTTPTAPMAASTSAATRPPATP